MKKAVAVTVALLAAWAIIIALGRGKKPGTDYGPGSDGAAVESPGDKRFKKAALVEVERTVASWPQASRQAVDRMIEKYGVPDETGRRRVVWNDNGPWKRTIVYRDAGRDVLEQVAAYHVPNDRYELIGGLPGNVRAERGRDEIAARSDSEALNLISLNLADEVISGKRPLEDARAEYDRDAKLIASGKATPYAQSLLFAEPEPATAAPAKAPPAKAAPAKAARHKKGGRRP